MQKKPKDPRSTQRKRARKVLENSTRTYQCECSSYPGCKHEGICGYIPSTQGRSDTLDANHINKNLFDLRLSNLEWLCRGCHKRADKRTERGVSTIQDEFGYGGLLEGTSSGSELDETVLHMQENNKEPTSDGNYSELFGIE